MPWIQNNQTLNNPQPAYTNDTYQFRLVRNAAGASVLVCFQNGLEQWSLSLDDLTSNPLLPIATQASVTPQVAGFCEQQASGTNAGGSTGGSWLTRVLNTSLYNTIVGCSLASNQITLPAGTFLFSASAPASGVNSFQTRLQNITASSTAITGSSEVCGSGLDSVSTAVTRSFLIGTVAIAGATVFALQQINQSSQATFGLGYAGSFGTEVYSQIQIWKIA
jgi:hypothetical protein